MGIDTSITIATGLIDDLFKGWEIAVAETAEDVAGAMRPSIPRGRPELVEQLTVESDGLEAGVGFDDPGSFYWRYVNDGTVHQSGQHFVEQALMANEATLAARLAAAGDKVRGL